MSDIREFQITWKRDLFFKKKTSVLAAKCLIRKNLFIARRNSPRQLENFKTVHNLNKSFAEYLQKRLKVLENEINSYNQQIKNLTEQEKQYWKQYIEIIEKNNQAVGAHVDKNNENIAPLKSKNSNKKTRKKKKCTS